MRRSYDVAAYFFLNTVSTFDTSSRYAFGAYLDA